jgi:ABC-type uncharacterized transport system ATPase subunit
MRLQLENYKKKYSVETEYEDISIEDHLDMFMGLLKQAGWQKKTVDDAIIELAESIKEEIW